MIIYKTTNLTNGKIYVGQDSNNDSKYFGSGLLLSLAIKKYGIKNFIKETLEECSSKEILNEREKYWIFFLKSRDLNIGYNLTEGDTGGKLVEVEGKKGKTYEEYYGEERAKQIKEKFSIKRKGVKRVYINTTAEETGKKISKSLLDKKIKRSDNTKQKISDTLKEYYKTDEGIIKKEKLIKRCKNKKISEETKAKIKKSMQGKRPKVLDVHPNARYWYFYDSDNNLILEIIGERTKALKDLKSNQRRIIIFDNLNECLNYNIKDKKNIDYKLYNKKYYNSEK